MKKSESNNDSFGESWLEMNHVIIGSSPTPPSRLQQSHSTNPQNLINLQASWTIQPSKQIWTCLSIQHQRQTFYFYWWLSWTGGRTLAHNTIRTAYQRLQTTTIKQNIRRIKHRYLLIDQTTHHHYHIPDEHKQ